ncbi:MAG TPA: hypothetical protein VF712_19485 [Thermoleophilaceae bacterium]
MTDSLSEEERGRIESYLAAIPTHASSAHARAQQEHIYTGLTIIDSKAQSMLAFNSFLVAIVGIYFGNIAGVRDSALVLIPFIVTVLASGASCLLCLDVIWVHWLNQDDMETPTEDDETPSEGFVELMILRDSRTRNYRRAWLLSFMSTSTVVVGVIIAMVKAIA